MYPPLGLRLGDSPPPPSALCQAQAQAGGEGGQEGGEGGKKERQLYTVSTEGRSSRQAALILVKHKALLKVTFFSS